MGVRKGFLKAVVLVHPSLTRVSVKIAFPVFGSDAWYTISCNKCYLYNHITKCFFFHSFLRSIADTYREIIFGI